MTGEYGTNRRRQATALLAQGKYRNVIDGFLEVPHARAEAWYLLALEAARGGRPAEARRHVASAPVYRFDGGDWFDIRVGHFYLPLLLRKWQGENLDLSSELGSVIDSLRYAFAQRLRYEAELIVGSTDEVRFMKQPNQIHIDVRLALAQALRADFADDTVAALDSYKRFLSHRDTRLSWEVFHREFAEWRVEELEGGR
jgi:hypothetical protein